MISWATQGKESFKGKRVAISGSGNVAQYCAYKVIELGGTVVSLSDSKGSLVVPEGSSASIGNELVTEIAALKVDRKPITDLSSASQSGLKYIGDGARPWKNVGKVDVALPSATQNEVSEDEAEALIAAGCQYIAEGSNMGCTQAAIDVCENSRRKKTFGSGVLWYAPGKAANAGGVAVSGLEMAQNSSRLSWTAKEVDDKLKDIMKNCFDNCLNTAKEYVSETEGTSSGTPSMVAGANIAGFSKVAGSMFEQGDWW